MVDVVEILSYTDTQSLIALGKKASDLRRQPHYVAATTFRSVMLLITLLLSDSLLSGLDYSSKT
jgi:hypothetical protein